jgi:hypothetical protein
MAPKDEVATQATEANAPEPNEPANTVNAGPASGADWPEESLRAVLGDETYKRLERLAEQASSLSEPAHNKLWELLSEAALALTKLPELYRHVVSGLSNMWFDPQTKIAKREWVLDGLFPKGTFVVWIGPEKSEKSLFGMRQAMCIACGKDWNGYHCVKPRTVSYLDSENAKEDLHERYHELLAEFSAEQKVLIQRNFNLVNGRDVVAAGMSLDYTNESFWKKFVSDRPSEVFYLDCLYMFHGKSATDNEGLLKVLTKLRSYCGYEKCVIVAHHTRKRSDEEAARKNTSLRNIGVRVWSDKAYGGGVFKKYADVIISQERFEKRNGDGNVTESSIDWQAYGRMIQDTPMLSFESDGEYRYRRHLVKNLSPGASAVLAEMRQKQGPWDSRHAVAKVLVSCSRSRAYDHLEELKIKGQILIGEDGRVQLVRL